MERQTMPVNASSALNPFVGTGNVLVISTQMPSLYCLQICWFKVLSGLSVNQHSERGIWESPISATYHFIRRSSCQMSLGQEECRAHQGRSSPECGVDILRD
jgi:hypothetical protein